MESKIWALYGCIFIHITHHLNFSVKGLLV